MGPDLTMGHDLWQRIAADAGTELTAEQLGRLGQYLDLLVAWNEKINLTRIVDRKDAEVRHVADALTLLRFVKDEGGRMKDERGSDSSFILPPSSLRLADVGTGGGVPGVPLAIARPDVQVTLIDSTRKKLDAIAAMVAELGLTNVRTLHTRIEAVTEKFDLITARAVADLDTLLGWCEPLMHKRTVLLAMKGPKAREEIEAIDRRRKSQFKIEVISVGWAELSGHVVVRVAHG